MWVRENPAENDIEHLATGSLWQSLSLNSIEQVVDSVPHRPDGSVYPTEYGSWTDRERIVGVAPAAKRLSTPLRD